ncbi:hypothetical protein VTI74DRAFT_4129 [Chaetomium olivicolor]
MDTLAPQAGFEQLFSSDLSTPSEASPSADIQAGPFPSGAAFSAPGSFPSPPPGVFPSLGPAPGASPGSSSAPASALSDDPSSTAFTVGSSLPASGGATPNPSTSDSVGARLRHPWSWMVILLTVAILIGIAMALLKASRRHRFHRYAKQAARLRPQGYRRAPRGHHGSSSGNNTNRNPDLEVGHAAAQRVNFDHQTQTVQQATIPRREEGLDEFGDAPPPYDKKPAPDHLSIYYQPHEGEEPPGEHPILPGTAVPAIPSPPYSRTITPTTTTTRHPQTNPVSHQSTTSRSTWQDAAADPLSSGEPTPSPYSTESSIELAPLSPPPRQSQLASACSLSALASASVPSLAPPPPAVVTDPPTPVPAPSTARLGPSPGPWTTMDFRGGDGGAQHGREEEVGGGESRGREGWEEEDGGGRHHDLEAMVEGGGEGHGGEEEAVVVVLQRPALTRLPSAQLPPAYEEVQRQRW